MIALIIVSDKPRPYVGLIADSQKRGEDVQRIANDAGTQYQFIRAGSERAGDYLIRLFEKLSEDPERGGGNGEESEE